MIDRANDAEMIEMAAVDLYAARRQPESMKTWDQLKRSNPDIAQIYRENARIVVRAVRRYLKLQGNSTV